MSKGSAGGERGRETAPGRRAGRFLRRREEGPIAVPVGVPVPLRQGGFDPRSPRGPGGSPVPEGGFAEVRRAEIPFDGDLRGERAVSAAGRRPPADGWGSSSGIGRTPRSLSGIRGVAASSTAGRSGGPAISPRPEGRSEETRRAGSRRSGGWRSISIATPGGARAVSAEGRRPPAGVRGGSSGAGRRARSLARSSSRFRCGAADSTPGRRGERAVAPRPENGSGEARRTGSGMSGGWRSRSTGPPGGARAVSAEGRRPPAGGWGSSSGAGRRPRSLAGSASRFRCGAATSTAGRRGGLAIPPRPVGGSRRSGGWKSRSTRTSGGSGR